MSDKLCNGFPEKIINDDIHWTWSFWPQTWVEGADDEVTAVENWWCIAGKLPKAEKFILLAEEFRFDVKFNCTVSAVEYKKSWSSLNLRKTSWWPRIANFSLIFRNLYRREKVFPGKWKKGFFQWWKSGIKEGKIFRSMIEKRTWCLLTNKLENREWGKEKWK